MLGYQWKEYLGVKYTYKYQVYFQDLPVVPPAQPKMERDKSFKKSNKKEKYVFYFGDMCMVRSFQDWEQNMQLGEKKKWQDSVKGSDFPASAEDQVGCKNEHNPM